MKIIQLPRTPVKKMSFLTPVTLLNTYTHLFSTFVTKAKDNLNKILNTFREYNTDLVIGVLMKLFITEGKK